jgi:hypothetical protein
MNRQKLVEMQHTQRMIKQPAQPAKMLLQEFAASPRELIRQLRDFARS